MSLVALTNRSLSSGEIDARSSLCVAEALLSASCSAVMFANVSEEASRTVMPSGTDWLSYETKTIRSSEVS